MSIYKFKEADATRFAEEGGYKTSGKAASLCSDLALIADHLPGTTRKNFQSIYRMDSFSVSGLHVVPKVTC